MKNEITHKDTYKNNKIKIIDYSISSNEVKISSNRTPEVLRAKIKKALPHLTTNLHEFTLMLIVFNVSPLMHKTLVRNCLLKTKLNTDD